MHTASPTSRMHNCVAHADAFQTRIYRIHTDSKLSLRGAKRRGNLPGHRSRTTNQKRRISNRRGRQGRGGMHLSPLHASRIPSPLALFALFARYIFSLPSRQARQERKEKPLHEDLQTCLIIADCPYRIPKNGDCPKLFGSSPCRATMFRPALLPGPCRGALPGGFCACKGCGAPTVTIDRRDATGTRAINGNPK